MLIRPGFNQGFGFPLSGRPNSPPIADTGGGGGGAYVAKAVHFDGSAWQKRFGGLSGVTSTPFGLFSCWVKSSDIFDDNGAAAGSLIDMVSGGVVIGDNGPNMFAVALHDRSAHQFFVSNNSAWGSGWTHLLMAWDTNHAAGQKIFQFYVTDVEDNDLFINDAGAPAFDVDWSPGPGGDTDAGWLSAGIGTGASTGNNAEDVTGPGIIGEMADYYLAPGQFLDLSVEANRRKFISATGKPVDLGSDGSTPTGTAPAILFSGDAATFGTNQGTGGAFTLTGTLTNATTSPSD